MADGSAPMPYTEADVARLRRLISNPSDVVPREHDGEPYPQWAARAVLAGLAAAGRLLPEGASLLGRGVDFASEHALHTVDGLADPFIQQTGSDRALAALRVRSWSSTHPGNHRLVSRDVTTYAGPWTPVDAALQDPGSTD